jgi:hypothetical protein
MYPERYAVMLYERDSAMIIFTSDFFANWLSPNPLLTDRRLFEFAFEFKEIYTVFLGLPAIFYSGKFLPILFNTESCDYPHYLQQGASYV